VDTPLPADYVPAAPGGLSPDGIVDVSAGALPEHTWYFKNANHEATGRCQPIIDLVGRLVSSAAYIDVHSDPAYPQFTVFDPPAEKTFSDFDTALAAILDWADRALLKWYGAKGFADWWRFWL